MSNDNDLEFTVGENEVETTVEFDADNAAGADKVSGDEPTAEELDGYSKGVKKRIDKLTARLREHQRREEAAIEYARNVQKSNEELQVRVANTNKERVGETQSRIETQIIALKNVVKRAREEGDIDTEVEAQQRMVSMINEQGRLSDAANYQAHVTRTQAAKAAQRPATQQAPQRPVDLKAEEWAENNPWYGKNTVMTNTVRGIHVELIQNEGFDPTSDEYYDEINRRIKDIFPQQFRNQDSSAQQHNRNGRTVQTVASATRSSGLNNSARRSIRLLPSEVAIAKSLGVPLEEYAKYVKR
jgi:hypothetical protein